MFFVRATRVLSSLAQCWLSDSVEKALGHGRSERFTCFLVAELIAFSESLGLRVGCSVSCNAF